VEITGVVNRLGAIDRALSLLAVLLAGLWYESSSSADHRLFLSLPSSSPPCGVLNPTPYTLPPEA